MIDPVGATDFDPQGSPSSENPDLVANVLDGDPATSWRTMTYDQNFGPGGLKVGVGVVVDLGSSQEVGQVDFHFVGSPTTVKLFLSDDHPSEVPTARPTAEGSADGEELTVELPDGASGRYLLVWLTRLPQVDGFRGEIAEIAVRS